MGPIPGMNVSQKKENPLPVPEIELRIVSTAACDNEIRMEITHNN
jgi:hypothetical protein